MLEKSRDEEEFGGTGNLMLAWRQGRD